MTRALVLPLLGLMTLGLGFWVGKAHSDREPQNTMLVPGVPEQDISKGSSDPDTMLSSAQTDE